MKKLIPLLLILLLLPVVMAFEFDNVKDYDEEKKEVTITNCAVWLVTCLVEGDEIAKVTLKSEPVVYVIRGNNRLVAEFEINNLDKPYSNTFNDMQFYDIKKGMSEFDRDFNYKYEVVTGTREVPIYKETCEIDSKNFSEVCPQEIIGYNTVDVYEWLDFDEKAELPVGTIKIGVFTDVIPDEKVEWIPTLFGMEIEEWGVWQESYNLGLTHAYNFDESSGTNAVDIRGGLIGNQYNFTLIGGAEFRSGKNGNAIFCDGVNDYANTSGGSIGFPIGTGEFAVSLWINSSEGAGWTSILANNAGAEKFQMMGFATNQLLVYIVGDFIHHTDALNKDEWTFIVIQRNVTQYHTMFANATYKFSESNTGDISAGGIQLCSDYKIGPNADNFTGELDAIYFWNRSLTVTEISDMYDNGVGTFYPALPNAFPNVTINSPTATTYDTAINYSITAVDDNLMDSCWFTINAGVSNETLLNTTSNDVYNRTAAGVYSDGAYTMEAYCNDSTNQINNTETVAFTVDTTFPEVTISVPANTSYTTAPVDINLTYVETNPSRCWYSNDSGGTNSTSQDCDTNFSSMNFEEGSTTITAYINDTMNHLNSSNLTFFIDSIFPDINITVPATNLTNSSNFNYNVNYTYSDTNVDSCWWSDDWGATNQTLTCGENLTSIGGWVEGLNQVIISINDTVNHVNSSSIAFTIDATVPEVVIVIPANTTYTTAPVDINITFTEATPDKCWYSNDSGGTNSSPQGCTTNFSAMNFDEGSTTITVWINDSIGNQNSSNVTFYLDTLIPGISIVSPANWTNTTAYQTNISYTYSELNPDTCWYTSDRGVTNLSIGCGTNITNETWGYDETTVIIYLNDTLNNINSTSVFFNISETISTFTYNYTTYETAREAFITNVTYTSEDWLDIGALLYHNGTQYTTTETGSGDALSFATDFDIPTRTISGNYTFVWNVALTNASGIFYFNSSVMQQQANLTRFDPCNATYNATYMNFTFANEVTLAAMTAQVTTSTFNYYLGGGTVNHSLSFSNISDNPDYAFCGTPPDKPLYVDLTFSYKNVTAPQRTYNPTSLLFSNATTNTTLYLLSDDDGLYVTFQVRNIAEQPVEGVEVTANRSIGGSDVTVSQGTTGAGGGVTFWLNPDFSHTFLFSHINYEDYITTLTPTQAQYTVTLGGGVTTVAADYTRGIIFETLPQANELFNDTTYTFEFNLTSSFWGIDSFGFNLRLSNGSIVGSDSSIVETIPAQVSYDVNTQGIIYMDYYWIIEGNTTSSTQYWIITNTEYSGTSIKNFFTDLNTYVDDGIFGIGTFGKLVIVFIVLFFSIGIMSYKFGITSPLAITGMIFAIVFFFDVVVDLIPTIRGIENLITYIAGMLLVGTIVREAAR